MRSLVTGLLALVLLLVPTAASAQADVESSDPADGAELTSLPATVSVTFTEQVAQEGASLQVLGSDGTRLDDEQVQVAGRRVLVGVRAADVEPGTFRLAYRVETSGGEAVTGEIPFRVTRSGAAQPGASASPGTSNDVRITEIQDGEESKWAPLWIMGFLVITSALLIYIVRAGLTSADGEDED